MCLQPHLVQKLFHYGRFTRHLQIYLHIQALEWLRRCLTTWVVFWLFVLVDGRLNDEFYL